MKLISLSGTRGIGKYTKISNIDYQRVIKYKWQFGTKGYVYRTYTENGRKYTIRLNRFIMNIFFGDKREVDHKNHDLLDNTRKNLRICTRNQNMANTKTHKDRKYKLPKGVQVSKKRDYIYYVARISVNGKRYSKSFRTISEAESHYNKMSKQYFGDFSVGES